jgi:DNA-binding MarR family transcriptional regulator
MKKPSSERGAVEDRHALTLHECISALMRDFRIEPGLLVGSVYADLHTNDIGLFEVLSGSESWTVRQIAVALSAPISTISSALDRLEKLGLVKRNRTPDDRRVVRIELTAPGQRLAIRLRKAHIENCHAMLARLSPEQREQFLCLAVQLAGK